MAVVGFTQETFTGMVGVQIYTWSGMQNGDTGTPVIACSFSDKTIQVEGTFGVGGAATIQGSNYTSSPTWATLNNAGGTALVIQTASPPHVQTILENPYQIRPNITGGDGTTALTVKLAVVTQARR